MREIVLRAARHLAAAVSGAVTSVLGGQALLDWGAAPLSDVGAGVEAVTLALALGVYALVEQLLKPLFARLFGGAS